MMVAPGGQIISANFASSQANMIVGTTSAASGKFSGPLTHSQIQGSLSNYKYLNLCLLFQVIKYQTHQHKFYWVLILGYQLNQRR